MKNPAVSRVLQLAMVFFAAFGAHDATAQGSSRMAVAVVDIQKILNESLAAQSIRKQVEAMSKSLGEDVRKARDRLRNDEKDLAGKRAILSPERFAQMRRELGQKATSASARSTIVAGESTGVFRPRWGRSKRFSARYRHRLPRSGN